MFGQAVATQPLSERSAVAARDAFQTLADLVRRSVEDGVLSAHDPRATAEVLWSAAHGVVSLEMTGFLSRPPRGQATFEALLVALLGPPSAGPRRDAAPG
jgi:hypothetical protein